MKTQRPHCAWYVGARVHFDDSRSYNVSIAVWVFLMISGACAGSEVSLGGSVANDKYFKHYKWYILRLR